MVSVLLLQFVACIGILITIQPPFVMSTPRRHDEAPQMCISRVIQLSLGAVVATLALRASGMRPVDTFTKTCEFLYVILKT